MLDKITAMTIVVSLAVALPALAQQPAGTPPTATIKRVLLQRVDVPGSNYEAVTGTAEVLPNVTVGRHTHPGPETGYVLEGDLTLFVDGQPALPLKAGDTYKIPPVAVHDLRSGDKGVKVLAVYVVEKGKPLASPAP